MEYIAPRDAAAPSDPYVDENPSSGQSGSVVPAAVFNWLQAEVLDVILGAGMAPDAVLQLKDAIIDLIVANAPGGGGGGGVPTTRNVNSGEGLSGGGNLSADRTLSFDFQGLTAEAAPALGHLIAIHNGANHRKLTLSALASLLAVSVVSQDVYTETSIANLGAHTLTPATIAITDRYQVAHSISLGGSYVQVKMDGAWQTIQTIGAPSQLTGGGSAFGRIGLAYNAVSGHLYKLTSPLSVGVAGIQGYQTAAFAQPWVAELIPGAWSGDVKVVGGSGTLTKLVPASLA